MKIHIIVTLSAAAAAGCDLSARWRGPPPPPPPPCVSVCVLIQIGVASLALITTTLYYIQYSHCVRERAYENAAWDLAQSVLLCGAEAGNFFIYIYAPYNTQCALLIFFLGAEADIVSEWERERKRRTALASLSRSVSRSRTHEIYMRCRQIILIFIYIYAYATLSIAVADQSICVFVNCRQFACRCRSLLKRSVFRWGWFWKFLLQVYPRRLLVGSGDHDHCGIRRHDVILLTISFYFCKTQSIYIFWLIASSFLFATTN